MSKPSPNSQTSPKCQHFQLALHILIRMHTKMCGMVNADSAVLPNLMSISITGLASYNGNSISLAILILNSRYWLVESRAERGQEKSLNTEMPH